MGLIPRNSMAARAVFVGNAAFQGRPETAAAKRRRRSEWGGIDDWGKIHFSVGKAGRMAMQGSVYIPRAKRSWVRGNMHLASTGPRVRHLGYM